MAPTASWTVDSLAEALGLELIGDGSRAITGVSSLDAALPEHLAFVARPDHAERLAATRAGTIIVPRELAASVPSVALIADNPHAAFARAAQLLHPDPAATAGMHATASVAADARLGRNVDIAANVVIGSAVVIGDGCRIGPGCVIEDGAVLGESCVLASRVVICAGSILDDRVRIQAGAIIGAEGFGYAADQDGWIRVPQVGRVVIGNDVHIGANTTIDRGALDDTVIGDGVIMDNQIQVAHNVRIGDHTAIAGCVGIAGSAVIGRRCQIGGGAGILGHLHICDDVRISAMSLVSRSIDKPGQYSSGTPLDVHESWRRNATRFRQLDQLSRRISALERALPDGLRPEEDS